MDNKMLYAVLQSDQNVKNINFLGVFPINLIPIAAVKDSECCMVINTKPHTHPGEHWVAIVKTADRKGIYFDSYGNPPFNMEEIGLVLDTCDDWTYNETRLQSSYSAVCGQYCIFFLTHIARGYNLKHIVHIINEGDSCANDALIFNYIKETYEHDDNIQKLKVIDFPFLFSQHSTSNNV